MTEKTTVLSTDPRLLSGPSELTNVNFGEDELSQRFRQNEDFIVVDLRLPRAPRVTLRELVDFNEGTTGAVPAIRVPTQVRLIDPSDESVSETLFKLSREPRPPHAVDVFELRPRIPFTLPSPPANQNQAIEAINDLLTIATQGSDADLEKFLASLQLDREVALVQLRRLTEAHRDAVQNAVDIVQTKRIDFLEHPQEAGIEGSIMAFIVAQVAENVIKSILGNVIELIATGVFSVIGRLERKRANETISAFIKQRQQELETTIVNLKKVQRKWVPENARGPRNAKNRLQNIFKERIGALKQDISQAKTERRLLLQGLLDDSIARAQALHSQLNRPIDKPGLLNKAGQFVTKKATEAVSDIPKKATQTKADSSIRASAVPLDVAMKMEVQGYFDPWLTAVEDSIRFLKQARLNVANAGQLPEEAIDEIISLVDLSSALDGFSNDLSSLTNDSLDLRADLTSYYELLLWLMMYRPRLSKMPTIARPGDLVTDRQGNLLGPEKVLPIADKGTMNLLKYLALRFFEMGKIKGEGVDAELVFSEEELKTVYTNTEELCAKLFAPRPAQRAAEGSGVETLSRVLKTIRFVVMPYES